MKIGFVGGDLRQLTLLECFKNAGHDVKIYGYDNLLETASSFDEINESDILIFPLPSCDKDRIYAPMTDKIININDLELKGFKMVFYGGANEILSKKLTSSGAVCINYLNCDDLAQKNAIATAEGTLEIAIKETAETVFGSKVLVTGFGRVSKAVSRMFKALGAKVTVIARRKDALSEAYCEGFSVCKMSELKNVSGGFDIIINTVPAVIFGEEELSCVKNQTLIIDLASKPGGVDFQKAKSLGKRVIWALSLPGKVAPVTSGKIVYETISSILDEREVNDDEP